jgi:tol-pal system protein YbgF
MDVLGPARRLRKGINLPTERHIGSWLAALLLAPLLACAPAAAEPVPQDGDAGQEVVQGPAPQGQGGGASVQSAPQAAADSALKQRVEQLEEQLVDLQVVIGTLESLARGGRGAAPSPAASGETPAGYGDGGDVRIDALETQVRALAAQIEQLSARLNALASEPRAPDAVAAQPASPAPAAGSGQPDAGRFGSTTVTAGTGDAIGGLIDGDGEKRGAPSSEEVAATPPAFMPPERDAAAAAANPKQLYETAYAYLMQRDYGAAQAAFEDFLARYPHDSLAGNAQYWLGEAHFVRGDYKAAAGAFLKGYQNYAGNARAADSLLKLAMSLDRLGQKDAACTSFAELSTRFPDAPENVKTRAKSERQRIGCR